MKNLFLITLLSAGLLLSCDQTPLDPPACTDPNAMNYNQTGPCQYRSELLVGNWTMVDNRTQTNGCTQPDVQPYQVTISQDQNLPANIRISNFGNMGPQAEVSVFIHPTNGYIYVQPSTFTSHNQDITITATSPTGEIGDNNTYFAFNYNMEYEDGCTYTGYIAAEKLP